MKADGLRSPQRAKTKINNFIWVLRVCPESSIFIEKCLRKNNHLPALPLLIGGANGGKSVGHSGTMASRWPLESSACGTVPTLAALARARPWKRLPRAFPASPRCHPTPRHGGTACHPALCRWRRRVHSKPILATKELSQKTLLALFAVLAGFRFLVPSNSLTLLPSTKGLSSLGFVPTYTLTELPVRPSHVSVGAVHAPLIPGRRGRGLYASSSLA